MKRKKFAKNFFFFLFLIIVILFVYLKFYVNKKTHIVNEEINNSVYNSNIIKNVEYTTKDKEGNEYFIKAEEGEIDFSNRNIIFLTKVKALIKLIDSEEVVIVSDFGKYNLESLNTIFSKNVIINYIDNKISGEYLEFSIERNSIIISRNVIYSNLENVLKADVVEIDIKTKDTKIFMYEQDKKINIKNKN